MKKNKSVAVVLILMIIICHLLVTFFKVNTDYFKYNYKFDKSEIVEAEVFYQETESILIFGITARNIYRNTGEGFLNMQEKKPVCM